jgi:hypothetical protein
MRLIASQRLEAPPAFEPRVEVWQTWLVLFLMAGPAFRSWTSTLRENLFYQGRQRR